MSYSLPRRRSAKPYTYADVGRARVEARCEWEDVYKSPSERKPCNRLGSVRVGAVHYCRQHARIHGYVGKR